LKNLLNYLMGYVVIYIKGAGVERFINFAVLGGIHIWDISWKDDGTVQAKVQLSYVKALRHVARKSRCRFRIVRRRGLPFKIKYFQKRKMLAFGAVMFIVTLYVLSTFAFFVEVTSQKPVKNINPQMIKRLAAEQGIFAGRPKWMMDFKGTEKYLITRVPQLSWVAIRAKGTKIEIEIVEKVAPEPGEKNKGPGNIVALKDGVITQILVMKGQPCVEPGDTVSRGQVLISGAILPNEESLPGQEPAQPPPSSFSGEKVQADGIVRARVWYRGYGECPVVEYGKRNTGKITHALSLKWQQKNVVIWGPKVSPYKLSIDDTKTQKLNWGRSIKLPVELIIVTYREQETYQKNWGTEGAWQRAVKIALASAKRQVPSQAVITDQEIRPVEGNGSRLKRACVILETEEDIGKFLPIE